MKEECPQLGTESPDVFTEAEVESLNAFQKSGVFHCFTCGNNRMDEVHSAYQKEHGCDYGQLIATTQGWICPCCEYRQGWAHDWMKNWGWKMLELRHDFFQQLLQSWNNWEDGKTKEKALEEMREAIQKSEEILDGNL